MPAPVIILSAASVDLMPWRDQLRTAFSRAGFRVQTQDQCLRVGPGDVKRLLADASDEATCVIHLARLADGSHATDPSPERFSDELEFKGTWSKSDYYDEGELKKEVIVFLCAPHEGCEGSPIEWTVYSPGRLRKIVADVLDQMRGLNRWYRVRAQWQLRGVIGSLARVNRILVAALVLLLMLLVPRAWLIRRDTVGTTAHPEPDLLAEATAETSGDKLERLLWKEQVAAYRKKLDGDEVRLRRELKDNEVSYGADHPKVATSLIELAWLLQQTGQLGEAEQMMRRALMVDQANYGPSHPSVVRDIGSLASVLVSAKRLSEAEPLMRRALTIAEADPEDDDIRLSEKLRALAQLLQDMDQPSEAEPLWRRVVKADEAVFGPDHAVVAVHLNPLAESLEAMNRFDEAELLRRRVVRIFEFGYGKDHPMVATALNQLAQSLQARNRLTEAEPFMKRALGISLRFKPGPTAAHLEFRLFTKNYLSILRGLGLTAAEQRTKVESLATELEMSMAEVQGMIGELLPGKE